MKKLSLIFTLLFSFSGFAAMEDRFGHLYLAGGPGIVSLGSLRIGHKDIEIGALNRSAIGVAKLFYKGNIYAGFGFAYVKGFGFYGGMGMDIPFWQIFSFRAEINSAQSITNFSEAGVIAGLTIHF